MKKVPSLFVRDWNGDQSRVLPIINPECAWVAAGEGEAYRKLDGTCCMVRAGQLFRRREVKPGIAPPWGFELADFDGVTGAQFGWLPVNEGPEDARHRAAFSPTLPDGTYELIGPGVHINAEGATELQLINHRDPALLLLDAPRDYARLTRYFETFPGEGIVWHHPDGLRMAKAKLRDFGYARTRRRPADAVNVAIESRR